ncbi:MAG: RNA polymerase Rpb4 family protein, partial [archaeon]|nr:RNA polymerase Rpb4 family protein [archaeon]
MIGKETLEKHPISLAHVKDLLESRESTKEASYEQNQTLEYVTKFAKLKKEDAEGLYNNLMNIEGMNEDAAVKIVDFLPEDAEALKLILPKSSKLEE